MIKNRSLRFRCEFVWLKTSNNQTPFTCVAPKQDIMRIPIAHGEGCYFASKEELAQMRDNNQILWQYCDSKGDITPESNPNGSLLNIAGICNKEKNVAGLMPHPERASEEILSSTDGKTLFKSMIQWFEKQSR